LEAYNRHRPVMEGQRLTVAHHRSSLWSLFNLQTKFRYWCGGSLRPITLSQHHAEAFETQLLLHMQYHVFNINTNLLSRQSVAPIHDSCVFATWLIVITIWLGPVPMAARSKVWVYGRSLAGFESNRGHGCLSRVSVVCCQLEVSESGWSLVQRSPIKCGVSKWIWSRNLIEETSVQKACQAMI